MVSIPDWARFRGIGETQKGHVTPGAKYHKQREEEAIKQAEDHRYFLTASRQFIEEKFIKDNEDLKKRSYNEKRKKDLRSIYMMKLTQAHLRGVGDIGQCTSLRICILSNNYITKIDALAGCVHLIRLDLHGNQIPLLPAHTFWSAMRHLCILNLHDNPLGRIENIHYLSACPSLLAVTLHDTPLSLKQNYRHHVVNSIWTLKALDRHVISDEEIIEDAEFGGRFVALHGTFKMNLCHSSHEDAIYTDELRQIRHTLADINQIMAHNSPVLIIQKYLRGFLLRKRYKMMVDMHLWAAVTIQRNFREWKGIGTHRSQGPPPPSPATVETRFTKRPLVVPQTDPIKLDYDTYMKNRRPGSVPLNEKGAQSPQGKQKKIVEVPGHILPSTPTEPLTPDHTTTASVKRKTSIHINLAKLHAGGTLTSLQDDQSFMDTVMSIDIPSGTREGDRTQQTRYDWTKVKKRKPPPEEKKRRVIKNVKQFFGPVVESSLSPEPVETSGPVDEYNNNNQELPIIDFRLRGRQQTVTLYDPTTDMILARRAAGKEIRAAEDEYHRQAMLASKRVPRANAQNNNQRMFARVQGTMGLTCLQAIQQAYKDREKAEKKVARIEGVMSMKEKRDTVKERIKVYHDEKRNRVLRERERDQQRVVDHLGKAELQRQNTMDRYKDTRKRSSNYQTHRKRERTFITDFNVQNTSVSNALLRHDRQAKTEDKMIDNKDKIQGQRQYEKKQQDVVKKYMEHRQLMRQTESAMSRAAIDTKMLQEANDRLLMAKARVAQQKSANAQVQAFYPLPALTNQSLPEREEQHAGSVSLKHFDKWNVNKMNRHHTVATM